MQDVLFVAGALSPIFLALWLGNLADRRRIDGRKESGQAPALLAYAIVGLFYALLIVAGLVAQVAGIILAGQAPGELMQANPGLGIDAATLVAALPGIGLGTWLPALVGLIAMLPPVRRGLARLIPIDPASTTSALALALPALIIVNLALTLGFGLKNLAAVMEAQAAEGQAYNPFPGIWAQNVLFLLLSLIGVGWLSGRRGLSAALQRLAIVLPTLRQALIGVGLGLVLAPIVILLESLTSQVGLGADVDVQRLTEQLIGPLTRSIPGVLTLGLAAALGEESLFRGALLPRFGLVLTSVLFALLHAQYGLSLSTLLVLIVGFVLGLVRQRTNTSTSMILHAVYNMTLGMIAFLGIGGQ